MGSYETILRDSLISTAIPMESGRPGGRVHLLLLLGGAVVTLIYLWLRGRKKLNFPGDECAQRRLFLNYALVFTALEVYKQLFRFFVVDGGQYNFWIFPFQLCSVPLYLCWVAFLVRSIEWRRRIGTFLCDFSLLGAVAALLVPEDMLQAYWNLTLHGFIWHFLMLILVLRLWQTGLFRPGLRAYEQAVGVLLLLLIPATLVNLLAVPRGAANMFYLSPLIPNRQLSLIGLPEIKSLWLSNGLYLFLIIVAGALIHLILSVLHRSQGGSRPAD